MMKNFTRHCTVAICLGAVLLFGSSCFAQSFPFLGVGSSAAFNAFAIGGASGSTPVCTNIPNGSTIADSTNVYVWTETGKSGHTYFNAVDNRNTGYAQQNAKGWIEWAGSADGTTLTSVCVYLATDSIVGNRMFFATNTGGTPAGTINFQAGCTSGFPIPGDQQIPSGVLPADTPLPAAVCSALNGKVWNAAPSDIRAEDASFGTQRACAGYSTTGDGFGYSCTTSPSSIHSGVGGSSGAVQTVTYAIAGQDPVTSTQIAHSTAGSDGHPFVELPAGGQAVLVLVNTNDASSTGFGTSSLFNISRPTLARVFSGHETRTRDIIPGSGLIAKPMTVLVREPLSGTFNTFEFQVTRTKEYSFSQEALTNNGGGEVYDGIGMPAVSGWVWEGGSVSGSVTGNPLDWKKTSTSGLKVRVIGTGEMVSTIASNAATDAAGNALSNQIGYTFFSFGNIKPAVGLAKYLLVDGVDPLFANASQNPGGVGVLPTCTAPCAGAVTLTNIANGSYPIWNILRVVTTGTLGATTSSGACESGATVCQMVAASQAAYAQIPDLVPFASMEAFRSHQTIKDNSVNFTQHNGFKHYAGLANTPCGFAPISGAAIQYECGGDVSGARYLIQEELDANTDTNAEIVGFEQ
ncbi:MAG: substrate-binding domain-containing protein [Candidatus Acidiferrales bacterium]